MQAEHETAIIKAQAATEFYTVRINIAATRCCHSTELKKELNG